MENLFELEQQHLGLKARLEDLLTETEGEITPEIEALMDEQLANEYAVSKKFDGYGYAIGQLTSEADFIKERIAALQERLTVKERAAKRLKDRLKAFMEGAGLKQVEGDYYIFRVQRNGGKVPVVMDESLCANDVPEHFRRVMYRIDHAAIYNALKEGEELDFAKLGERGTHLRIK